MLYFCLFEGSGFSILSQFGRGQDSSYAAEDIRKKTKRNEWLEKNPFKYDSSDSEDEDEDGDGTEGKSRSSSTLPVVDPKLEEFSRNLSEKSKSTEAR